MRRPLGPNWVKLGEDSHLVPTSSLVHPVPYDPGNIQQARPTGVVALAKVSVLTRRSSAALGYELTGLFQDAEGPVGLVGRLLEEIAKMDPGYLDWIIPIKIVGGACFVAEPRCKCLRLARPMTE